MSTFTIKRRDAKTGNKQEKEVRKLSPVELKEGSWARAATGTAHHFFVGGTSVCGRPRPAKTVTDTTRKLCPECWAATSRAIGRSALEGF